MPIAVIGQFRLPVERLDEARPVMRRVVAATRAEDGCIAYSYAEDLFDPGLIRVSELWHSREQLRVHFETAHMQRWIVERAELGLTERVITAYELGEGETL